jgi:hypothetical protein
VIKIKVTDEMKAVMDEIEDGPNVDEKLARAVLDLVERDLNITDNLVGRHKPGEYNQIVKSNGCIEVTM